MSFFYFTDDLDDAQAGALTPESVALVIVGGELDYAASPELRERIDAHIKAGKRRLVIDLADATFIDSTAIGVIVGAISKLNDLGGGSLAVVCTHRNVLNIFEMTGLDDLVALHPSREEALSAVAPAT